MKGETEMTKAALHAEVVGARQELGQAQLQKEQTERQWNKARHQLEEVQAELRTAHSQLAGDLIIAEGRQESCKLSWLL